MRFGLVTVRAVKTVTFTPMLSAFGTRVDDFGNPSELIEERWNCIGQIDQQIPAGRGLAVMTDGNRCVCLRRLVGDFVRNETARAKRP